MSELLTEVFKSLLQHPTLKAAAEGALRELSPQTRLQLRMEIAGTHPSTGDFSLKVDSGDGVDRPPMIDMKFIQGAQREHNDLDDVIHVPAKKRTKPQVVEGPWVGEHDAQPDDT